MGQSSQGTDIEAVMSVLKQVWGQSHRSPLMIRVTKLSTAVPRARGHGLAHVLSS